MASTSVKRVAAGSSVGNVRGMGWMLLTGLLFVGVTGIVRHLGTDMSPVQAAFIRYAFGLVMLAPVFVHLGPQQVRSARIGLHALRGLLHGIAVMLWFFAMARLPIAEVTALGYTAPIFTTIGAAIFLGEVLRARRIVAVVVAFLGALVILRPGIEVISVGAVAQLTAAPLFACSFLLAKRLTEQESSAAIVGFLSVFVTLVLLPPALLVWRAPTWEELFWLLLTAGFATAGHFTLTQAFRAADLAVTQPVGFLQLVWATLLGLYAFGESPDLWVWAGAAIIVGSATYIAHREALHKGRAEPKIEAG